MKSQCHPERNIAIGPINRNVESRDLVLEPGYEPKTLAIDPEGAPSFPRSVRIVSRVP
jgi:hypothetical protein